MWRVDILLMTRIYTDLFPTHLQLCIASKWDVSLGMFSTCKQFSWSMAFKYDRKMAWSGWTILQLVLSFIRTWEIGTILTFGLKMNWPEDKYNPPKKFAYKAARKRLQKSIFYWFTFKIEWYISIKSKILEQPLTVLRCI